MANNRVIGLNGQMPWHLSADLKKFKQITLGHPIVMGRKTHEAIGRVLPGRENIVISRNQAYHAAGCVVFHDINQAIRHCASAKELFVIGGADLYQAFLPLADLLYLTQIQHDFQGDTYFPAFDLNQWQTLHQQVIQDDSTVDFSYSFLTLQKIPPNRFYNEHDL